jgi:hypothetical protein
MCVLEEIGGVLMQGFRALGIDSTLAQQIRASGRDAFGGMAEVWYAKDTRLPCRHCLEEAPLNSTVLLVSYKPLVVDTPYAGRGPIFLCGHACAAFDDAGRVPATVASRHVNLRAYTASGQMIYRHSRLAQGQEAGNEVAAMLEDNDVAEVHAHTALHGCYLCRFVRV